MDISIQYIKENSADKQIYIWGAWERGLEIEDWLNENKIDVAGYIDSKNTGMYNGKKIVKFEELDSDKIFVIVSIIYHPAVKKSLKDCAHLYMGTEVGIRNVSEYSDLYGNVICGNVSDGNITMAAKSKIHIGENIHLTQDVRFKAESFSNLDIGDNAAFKNDCDIQCLNRSKIKIGKKVKIDKNVKIICRDSSAIIIEDGVKIGFDTTITCKNHSQITIKSGSVIDHNIIMEAKDHSLMYFEDKVHLCRYARVYSWNGGDIYVGGKTSLGQQLDLRSGTGTKFICGRDCMVSYQVRMRSHNGHTVIDKNNKCAYKTRENVIIGDHVWIGTGSVIMPGTKIGDGSVVGANTFTNKEFGKNVMLVGSPAKVIHEGIDWDRREAVSYEEWEQARQGESASDTDYCL